MSALQQVPSAAGQGPVVEAEYDLRYWQKSSKATRQFLR